MKLREVFIRNWETKALTGIYPHEKTRKQWIRLNIALFQEDKPAEAIENVIDYSAHKARIETLLAEKHYPLLEIMADAVAKAAFEDRLVRKTRITIEKLGLYKDAESCGVTIERDR